MTWGFSGFICNSNAPFCPSSSATQCTALYWHVHCVCVQGGVCLFTVHTAVVGWQQFWQHSHPVRMTERQQVRGKIWAICLQHSGDSQTARAPCRHRPPSAHTTHDLTSRSSKGQREHNETVIINTTRAEQSIDTLSALPNDHSDQSHWGMTFQMSKPTSETGPEVVKDYMAYFMGKKTQSLGCALIPSWSLHKPVDGLLSSTLTNPGWSEARDENINPSHVQVSAARYLWGMQKESREAGRHCEVFLVAAFDKG